MAAATTRGRQTAEIHHPPAAAPADAEPADGGVTPAGRPAAARGRDLGGRPVDAGVEAGEASTPKRPGKIPVTPRP